MLGSLGALIPCAIWQLDGDELLQALAFVGFFLNLFNLLPVLPLDGGRAMAALTPKMWFVGYLGADRRSPSSPRTPSCCWCCSSAGSRPGGAGRRARIRRRRRTTACARARGWAVAAVYIGLAVLLAIGMDATFLEREFSDAQ